MPTRFGDLVHVPEAVARDIASFVVECREHRKRLSYKPTPKIVVNLKGDVPSWSESAEFLMGLSAATRRYERKYHLNVQLEVEDLESRKTMRTIDTWNAMLEHQGRDELRVIGDAEWKTDWEVGHVCADS
jgi:hypothetical protein